MGFWPFLNGPFQPSLAYPAQGGPEPKTSHSEKKIKTRSSPKQPVIWAKWPIFSSSGMIWAEIIWLQSRQKMLFCAYLAKMLGKTISELQNIAGQNLSCLWFLYFGVWPFLPLSQGPDSFSLLAQISPQTLSSHRNLPEHTFQKEIPEPQTNNVCRFCTIEIICWHANFNVAATEQATPTYPEQPSGLHRHDGTATT